MTLWVDAWQMQCCGEPFRLGSQVAWTLREADPDWLQAVLGAETSPGVDGAEEHHGGIPEDTEPTRGVVTRISAVHCRYAPRAAGDPRALYPLPGSGVLTDVDSADGWVADRGEERFVGYVVQLGQVNCDTGDDLVAYRDAELALLAARFSLPGPRLPDVDRAIELACRLLAGNLETPATTEVACLAYGTPLRDAEPVLRQMLFEHGIAVSGPETGGAGQFRAALRAFGASAIDIGEFSAIFYRQLPAWNEQDATQRALVLLLNELDQATTRDDQGVIIQRLRDTALAASQET
jgi:hypothetical protein